MKPKIIVILGPTASGKSDLAVRLAKKQNGEVVSADSRQVFKGLDIGSGKITKKEMKGIPHHLLDVISPAKRFSVDVYQKLAYKAIDDILSRAKLPIVCGGTGFYIQSIVDGLVIPDVPFDKKLRARLAKLNAEELFSILRKLDPAKARNVEKKNPVRLIRAIEISKGMGKNKKLIKKPKYEPFQIGIKFSLPILQKRIEKRLIKRLGMGMVEEVKRLHKRGLSWKRMEELGLEYRYLALYLQGKMTEEEMINILKIKSFRYAKKQMTWFKRDKRIRWIEVG